MISVRKSQIEIHAYVFDINLFSFSSLITTWSCTFNFFSKT